ncbi:porin [Candidimonas sp. SYP-B2681]|uniref:porin n=1 Tax=Candidimonas sp. SYP-B2681 TaxID=2497686 RepID=UPI000F870BDC|nr:porin [Candidimonas sp. SYP-B2681]RTZ47996.1 porin [Candidimonas sp. SYP-B2681]
MNARFLCVIALITSSCTTYAGEPYSDDSGLNLYGAIDSGFSSTRVHDPDGTRQKLTGLISGGLEDSVLGFRGREMVSDGWAAVFQLETEIDNRIGDLDDNKYFFSRTAWLGLASERFGEIRLGRQHTVAQEFSEDLEIASWKAMGMEATFLASEPYSIDNAISYLTPKWGGLRFGASHSFDVTDDQTSGSRSPAYSAALKYERGPTIVAITWDKTILSDSVLTDPHNPEAWQLGVSYDFEIARLSLAWSRQKNGYVGLNGGDPGDLGLGLGAPEFANGGRLDAFLLGVAIPLSARGTLLAQWSLVKPDWSWGNGEKAENGQVATLGYVFTLSPRTRLYAAAGLASRYSLDDQIVQGQGTTTRVMAGIHHRF